jgi:hypothetical protein
MAGMPVLWESTDQFGNMFIGVSHASDLAEFLPDVKNLVEELEQRHADGVVTVDFGFGEVNGPNPDAVSHVLQSAWLEECDADEVFSAIEASFGDWGSRLTLARA